VEGGTSRPIGPCRRRARLRRTAGYLGSRRRCRQRSGGTPGSHHVFAVSVGVVSNRQYLFHMNLLPLDRVSRRLDETALDRNDRPILFDGDVRLELRTTELPVIQTILSSDRLEIEHRFEVEISEPIYRDLTDHSARLTSVSAISAHKSLIRWPSINISIPIL